MLRHLTSLALLVTLVTSLVVSPATAAGTIGVYADAAGTQSTLDVIPFAPTDIYVVGRDLPEFNAYEVGLGGLLEIASILGVELFGPAPLDFGSAANYIVGTGGCVSQSGTLNLVTLQVIFLSDPPDDTLINIVGANPSSFATGEPGYNTCDGALVPFDVIDGGGLMLNSTGDWPPPEDRSTRILLDSVEGNTGDLVTMPVRLTQALNKGDAGQLAGIDLELGYDEQVAIVENVRLAPINQDWLIEFNVTPNAVDIAAAGTSPDAIPSVGDAVFLEIDFRLLGIEAATPVDVTSSRLFDLDQVAIEHEAVGASVVSSCDNGDPVNDDEYNTADAIRTLLASLDLVQLTELESCAADVNDDGTIDVGDAILILQAAAGSYDPTLARTTFDPSIYVRAGDAPGEMLIFHDGSAGLDVILAHDEENIRLRSVTDPVSGGLLVFDDGQPGIVRIGLADTAVGAGVLHVRFEVDDPTQPIGILAVNGYDTDGVRTPLEIPTPSFQFGVTGVDGVPGIGRALEWVGAHPNPFNPRTEIRFRLAAPGDARVSFYDAAGRRVHQIVRTALDSGEQTIVWNGEDASGHSVASGVYHVVVEAAGESAQGRVTLLK